MNSTTEILRQLKRVPSFLIGTNEPRCRNSVFDNCSESLIEEALRLLDESPPHSPVQRAVGSLLGLACGDSIGAPLEFLPVTDELYADEPHFEYPSSVAGGRYFQPWNKFGLEPGQVGC